METSQLIDVMRTVIREELVPVNEKLTIVDERLTSVEGRLTSVEGRLTSVEGRLTSVEDRLSVLEIKHEITHRKLNNLEFNFKVMEREFKKDIRLMNDSQETLIAVMEAKGVLPRVEGR